MKKLKNFYLFINETFGIDVIEKNLTELTFDDIDNERLTVKVLRVFNYKFVNGKLEIELMVEQNNSFSRNISIIIGDPDVYLYDNRNNSEIHANIVAFQ